MCNRIVIQMDTRVKTVTGPTSIMVRVEVQRQWEGDLCGGWTRGAKPLLEGSQRRGDTPSFPSFRGNERGEWEGT